MHAIILKCEICTGYGTDITGNLGKGRQRIFMSKAVKFHGQGYNCAESIIKAFNEEHQLDIPVGIASPFGGGMAVGATCGAITGAIMAVGAVYGRADAAEQNESRQYARVIMNKVQEKYGTYECIALKKQGVSCDEIIAYTYQLLNENVTV